MCGRYSDHFLLPLYMVLEHELDVVPGQLIIEWEPSANVAPSQPSPIVLSRKRERTAQLSLFGFDAPTLGKRIVNARSESLREKKMFARALRERRCLVVADGFYEWTGPAKARVPHFVTLPEHAPMTFAGLYQIESTAGGAVLSHVILTADAGPSMSSLSDREPVIVSPDMRDAWLGGEDHEAVLSETLAKRSRVLEHWQVSARVNRPGPTDPELRAPVVSTPPRQGSLF